MKVVGFVEIYFVVQYFPFKTIFFLPDASRIRDGVGLWSVDGLFFPLRSVP
jgi:hypothetical protein